jgi:uncharacterized protein (TIGR02996 family)
VRERPDDLAVSQAYADWLCEHGDPLGEFIQVQLTLEDESKPRASAEAGATRTATTDGPPGGWLGELAEVLRSPEEAAVYLEPWEVEPDCRFVRGRLDRVQIPDLTVEQARIVAVAADADGPAPHDPRHRLLRRTVRRAQLHAR